MQINYFQENTQHPYLRGESDRKPNQSNIEKRANLKGYTLIDFKCYFDTKEDVYRFDAFLNPYGVDDLKQDIINLIESYKVKVGSKLSTEQLLKQIIQ